MGLPRALPMRWLLVTVVGAGVVAMHVLVYLGGCGGGSTTGATTLAGLFGGPVAASGGTHTGAGGTHLGSGGTRAEPGGMPGMASSAGHHPRPAGQHATGPRPSGAPDCGMLGHFCLAVLDAFGAPALLALLLLAAGIGGPGLRFDSPRRRARSPRGPPDRPPSRTSLTELCVARR